MAEEFDPYLQWLGIRDPQRPPNHYRLLGVELFENDPDVISNAADRQMAHVRTFQSGRRSAESQKLLNELAGAKVCLLNPQKKAAYDDGLKAELASASQPTVVPVPDEAIVPALPPSLPSPRARRFSALWVIVPTLVAAAMLAALLTGVFNGGLLLDADGNVAQSNRDVTADTGDPSRPPGATASDTAAQGRPHPAGDVKSGQPAKPEPGKSADAKQAAKPMVEPAKKIGPPPKPESKVARPPMEPAKLNKPEVKPEAKPETKPEAKAPGEQLPPAAQSMAAARTAMQQRNVLVARRHFLLAEKAASAQEKERIGRLKEVLTLWEEFWAAVRNGILECKDREILRAERLSVEVVDRADGVITVRGDVDGKKGAARGDAGGKKRAARDDADGKKGAARDDGDGKKGAVTFGLQNLPAPLAMVLAEKKLPENTASLSKAAFLIVDPQGDPRRAMELCEQSARRGTAPSPGLTAEAKEALAAAGSPPDPGAASAKPPARLPVPDAAAQEEEQRKVRDAFRARLDQASTPIHKSKLAAELLRDAKESKDSAAARFALLVEAGDLALAAGELARFREIVLEMVQRYEIDSFQEQARALVNASHTGIPSTVRTTLANFAIDLAQEAIQADAYDSAAQLAKAGFTFATKVMASKGRDPHIIGQARELREAIPRHKEQYDLAVKAEKALAQDPNNVKAVQFLGKYYALGKEQWDRGLPLLLKSDDATLKALAEAEHAARRSVTAADMLKLAGQWTEALPSLEGSHERSARRRAIYWYEAALPWLSGLPRAGAQRAVESLKQGESARRK